MSPLGLFRRDFCFGVGEAHASCWCARRPPSRGNQLLSVSALPNPCHTRTAGARIPLRGSHSSRAPGFPLSSSQLILYQAAESGPAFLPHLPSRLSPRPAALEPHCPLSPLDRAARVPASGPAHWPWPAALLPPVVVAGGAFPDGPTPLPHPALAESGVPFPVCPLVCHHCAPVPSPTPLICLVRLR